jgi:hypothetical protein
MKQKFIVLGCNPSNEGKTFVWKLQSTVIAEAFGIKKTVKRTYYIGGMPEEIAAGTELVEDMAKFEVTERPYDVTDDITGEVTTIMLKWLHVKA